MGILYLLQLPYFAKETKPDYQGITFKGILYHEFMPFTP